MATDQERRGQRAYELLNAAIKISDWPGARAALDTLIEIHPQSHSLIFSYGSVLRNEYRVSMRDAKLLLRADAAYAKAIELAPRHEEAAVERASLANELHRVAVQLP